LAILLLVVVLLGAAPASITMLLAKVATTLCHSMM
jgi:hypothetical protein